MNTIRHSYLAYLGLALLASALTAGPAHAWNMGPSMGAGAASSAASSAAAAAAAAAANAGSNATNAAVYGARSGAGGSYGGSGGGGGGGSYGGGSGDITAGMGDGSNAAGDGSNVQVGDVSGMDDPCGGCPVPVGIQNPDLSPTTPGQIAKDAVVTEVKGLAAAGLFYLCTAAACALVVAAAPELTAGAVMVQGGVVVGEKVFVVVGTIGNGLLAAKAYVSLKADAISSYQRNTGNVAGQQQTIDNGRSVTGQDLNSPNSPAN